MNEHARHHDPDQIVPAGIVSPPRTLRPAVSDRQAGFWEQLTTIERAAFLASAREVVYPVGTVLWAEGQAADTTIVIKSGSVRISVERGGRERFVAFRGPGDIIGERAALLLRRRSATVVAMGTLHALLLTTQEFVTYLSDHPRVVAVLEREVYERMTEQQNSAQPPEQVQYAAGATHPYGPAAQYGPPQQYATAYVEVLPHYHYAMAGPFTVTGSYTMPDPRAGGAAYAMERAGASAPSPTVPARTRPSHAAAPGRSLEGVVVPSCEQPTQPMNLASREDRSWAGQNCTIVYTDVARFSSPERNDVDRIDVRHAMYRALREAFEDATVPWSACHVEDRGDGALIVVPAEVPTGAVIDPMLESLGTRLGRHNRGSSGAVRVQLRVAVNVGPVMPDPPGVSGSSIITTARLLDAPPLKARLAATGADLGVIASRFVYDSVIVPGPFHVSAAAYERISCRVKESDVEGWIRLHGQPALPAI
ncbi:Crp/Fnr family transcriptional regulator [Spirillospora sp. CA-128828]|uniref:Crp/Fnr family transcriptional regulator n=1 Tax=Spirillospora sp. CA-128828 TaxID=3240033 RepID=UPI003D93CD4C